MFHTSHSPSFCRPQGAAEPLMWELPEGKDQVLILSQEQAHSELSHCQSLNAPAPLHPLGIPCIWAALFWIIIMSPSKIFIKFLHTYCSGHTIYFCSHDIYVISTLSFWSCLTWFYVIFIHHLVGHSRHPELRMCPQPSLCLAVAKTLGLGAGDLGSGINRMAASSKYSPEQNELTYVVAYNLKSYHS